MQTTSSCKEWPGALDGKGYGTCTIDKKQYGVHRLAFFVFNGYFPKTCRHRCGNPKCVNPDHLMDGTKGDNNRDTVLQGRNINAAKTHCKYGHQYTEENTYRVPSDPSKRFCKECRKLRRAGLLKNMKPIDNRPTLPEPTFITEEEFCSQGHRQTMEGTYLDKSSGRRRCRACQANANRKAKYRREMRMSGFDEQRIKEWIEAQDWSDPERPGQRRPLQIPEA